MSEYLEESFAVEHMNLKRYRKLSARYPDNIEFKFQVMLAEEEVSRLSLLLFAGGY
jgi:hypothetical protein